MFRQSINCAFHRYSIFARFQSTAAANVAKDTDYAITHFVKNYGYAGIGAVAALGTVVMSTSIFLGTYSISHQMNYRFNEIDSRFNEINSRFNKIDSRFNEIKSILLDHRQWQMEQTEKQNKKIDQQNIEIAKNRERIIKLDEKFIKQDQKLTLMAASISSAGKD